MKNYLENVDREALRARAEQMLHYADEARGTASRWTNHAVDKARGCVRDLPALARSVARHLLFQVLQKAAHAVLCGVRGELAVYALADLLRRGGVRPRRRRPRLFRDAALS